MSGFVVSVTRFHVRSLRFLPFFLIHAQRCLAQIRRADGYMAGALRHDRDHAYWTTSVWRDEAALMAYVTGGAHRNAMPKLSEWGDEASTVRWIQDSAEPPSWPEAIERMRRMGILCRFGIRDRRMRILASQRVSLLRCRVLEVSRLFQERERVACPYSWDLHPRSGRAGTARFGCPLYKAPR